MNNQRTSFPSKKKRPRCYAKSPTVQDVFWPIPSRPHVGSVCHQGMFVCVCVCVCRQGMDELSGDG